MASSDGRWTIVYNGELYNAASLRSALPRQGLSGHSDTQVLLETISACGVVHAVSRANGMFAFAVWDAHEQRLWLARDRFGEKPLYYGWHQGAFIFASELKALRATEGFSPAVDRSSLSQLLRFGFVPGEGTIYQGVFKLSAGTYAAVDASTPRRKLESIRYWNPVDDALATKPHDLPQGEHAVDELAELLQDVVTSRMVSDVPLGAFLSGGIDSSTVVALMEQASSAPVRTFTIGFTETGYDESVFAREVARHLGTDHTELILSSTNAMGIIPRLARIFCEPFADSSQIPTFLVSHLARQHVTVALSGDGGDELFGGYDRYRVYQRLMGTRSRVPRAVRTIAGRSLLAMPGHRLDAIAQSRIGGLAPAGMRHRTGERAHKLGRLLTGDGADTYRNLMSGNLFADQLVIGSSAEAIDDTYLIDSVLEGLSPLDQAMLLDTLTYLPDDLLVKVDRASMANSLEVRVPLLDPEVFRFAWGLHPGDKVRDGKGKWVLRQLLKRHLPADLVDRPKMGFGVPIGAWLRGPLSAWAEELLAPDLLAEQGYLHPLAVSNLWQDHLKRRSDNTYQLWPILMFQAWLQEWM